MKDGYTAGIITASISAIITALSLHLFSRRRDKLIEFNRAAEKFRNAFMEVRTALEPSNPTNVHKQVFENAHTKNNEAVIEFKLFLSKEESYRLESAWYAYYSDTDQSPYYVKDVKQQGRNIHQMPYYENYTTEDGRRRALSRIETILNFAKPKDCVFYACWNRFIKLLKCSS